MEDFSGLPAGQDVASGQTFSNSEFSFTASTGDGSDLYRSSIDAPLNPWLSTFIEEVSITFTFDSNNVTAFGANFWVTNLNENPIFGTISVALNGQAPIALASNDSGSPAFLGFISTDETIFETLTISTSTNDGFVTIGNAHVGTAIPEPSVYAVLVGLACIGLVVWRRRKV